MSRVWRWAYPRGAHVSKERRPCDAMVLTLHRVRSISAYRKVAGMAESEASNGRTRVEYLLGVPLDANVVRQWPQMQEAVHGSQLIGDVEGNFEELTLEVGRRLKLDDVIVVEWTCNYGDGRLYRNVTIGELEGDHAVKVTDYWGEPTTTPEWRRDLTSTLPMPADGIWPDNEHLKHY